MPRLTRPAKRLTTRRVAPILLAAEVAREAKAHWDRQLTDRQRRRLVELVKESGGRPGRLSPKQKEEVRGLVGDLELTTLFRHLAATAATRGGSKAIRRR